MAAVTSLGDPEVVPSAVSVARDSGSAFGAGLAISSLADALRAQGDLERVRSLLEESLTSLRRQEHPPRLAYALAITLARLASIEREMGRDVPRREYNAIVVTASARASTVVLRIRAVLLICVVIFSSTLSSNVP